MKIVLTSSTLLIALLAIGIIIGINNNNILGNIFAQEGNSEIPPLVEPDRNVSITSMPTTTTANQSQHMMMDLNGTINVETTIAEAFKSKVTTDIIGAIQAAQANVGANSVVKEAELTHAHGYLVYKITAVDENMKKYKVIVDPGNGQVLMKKEVTGYEDKHDKMKYCEEREKYDKYNYFSGHGIPDEKTDEKTS
jgi:Peptidase propeptide and YPEB domain